jgi:hypothetical protein
MIDGLPSLYFLVEQRKHGWIIPLPAVPCGSYCFQSGCAFASNIFSAFCTSGKTAILMQNLLCFLGFVILQNPKEKDIKGCWKEKQSFVVTSTAILHDIRHHLSC